jgi:hypothetical protein
MSSVNRHTDGTQLPVFTVDEFTQFTECLTADGGQVASWKISQSFGRSSNWQEPTLFTSALLKHSSQQRRQPLSEKETSHAQQSQPAYEQVA